MWFRRFLAILSLTIIVGGAAQAQVAPAGSILPWNKYQPQRVVDGYVPIIGLAGTTRFGQGTANDSKDASATAGFTLTLPFPFQFINTSGNAQTFAAGANIRVGANGWISFGATPSGGVPDLSSQTGFQLICPYWSDIQPLGTPEGGVYWRVDGQSPNKVLTVEWRVQGVNTPTRNPGDFQAKLYETSNKIVFYYGPASVSRSDIPVSKATTVGAVVGLKASGPGFYENPQSPPDNSRFLLFLNPDVIRDTVALTHTRAGQVNTCDQFGWCFFQSVAETYAYWGFEAVGAGARMSPYWHYQFPTLNGQRIGYSMSPVDNDVAADTLIYNPAAPGNAYRAGSSFELQGRFKNIGANSRQNVPVQLDIYRGNTFLESRTGNAFPTNTTSGGVSTTIFAPFISVGGPGTYTVKLYSKLAIDQDASNDTLTSTFFVSYTRDVLAQQILDPKTFTPAVPSVYPVNSPVQPEGRFVNIGTTIEANVRVGYSIYDASGVEVFSDKNSLIRGTFGPLEIRDVVFPTWTPTSPGDYYIRIYSLLDEDEQKLNDTVPGYPSIGRQFSVRYNIEVEPLAGSTAGTSPGANTSFPEGRPINIVTAYRNNGIVDATNVPARVQIKDPSGQIVYNQVAPGAGVPVVPGSASGNGTVRFYAGYPFFIARSGPGTYCVTSIITDAQDPIRTNDTTRFCFNVKARLLGTIYVGTGERFRTIQEANDSLYTYGVAGPVNFKLVDDNFTVRPVGTDASLPALDGRGDIIGSGPNSVVTWSAVEGKTSVNIRLKSPSGIGIIYGQRDTSNSTGYITWDGGPNKILHFIMDTLQVAPFAPFTRSIPIFLSQGASNYTFRNVTIDPSTVPVGLKTVTAGKLPISVYNRANNSFTFDKDEKLALSTGILLRNSAPSDADGNNVAKNGRFRDTIQLQNNLITGTVIHNFAYGITSIGAGPLVQVRDNRYFEYHNQNNTFSNNLIEDVTRGGIVLAFEKNSTISGNTIRRVVNTTTVPHAAGIWVSAGGYTSPLSDTVRNRAYSTDLLIERNRVSTVSAAQGNGAAIWLETTENLFTSLSKPARFPLNAVTNFRVWNNMVNNYQGQGAAFIPATGTPGQSAGIALTMAGDTRVDYVTLGNSIDNNTLFNQIAGSAQEYGIADQRAGGMIRNNIISILTPALTNPTGLVLQVRNDITPGFFGADGNQLRDSLVKSDYNLFWVPNGFVGALSSLSSTGFNIPSPPRARTLNQWRALSGQDLNSVEGNITTEFLSIVPGSEDLHIRTGTAGSLANNRGINIAGLTQDFDGEPRGSAATAANYDIGADEFNGIIRNNDLIAEDIIAPVGYRATTGQYSDAEYVMGSDTLQLRGRFRNIGGVPQVSNNVSMTVEYFNGTSFVTAASGNTNSNQAFNIAQAKDISFGNFMPRTLRELGMTDAFYGANPNITPIYRFTIKSSPDDFNANNIYQKTVRFYVPRSTRKIITAVEKYQPTLSVGALAALSVVDKSNKLNADSLIAAFNAISFFRAGLGIASQTQDYDLFERDKWPADNLNFNPWKTVVWAQGAEPQGLEPQERAALKMMLSSRNYYDRSNLIMAGQDVIRIHDVALTNTNGQVADQDFVRNYLRAQRSLFTGPHPNSSTNPINYDQRQIRGVAITPGKTETIAATAVVGDNPPNPVVMVPTIGDGLARATHIYMSQALGQYRDSSAGVASAASIRNVVFYGIDWRHFGRYQFEALRSGGQRVLLGALDFTNQYGGALPLDMISFVATPVGRNVRVAWETASEKEVASLEVERAVVETTPQGDRVGSYTLINRRSPEGSVSRGAKYSYDDENVQRDVTYRYRLISVGLDGSRREEGVDQVKIGSEDAGFSLSVLPNPARTQATINVNVPAGATWSVELFDGNGRLVKTLANRSTQSISSINLNVEDLASGAYTLRLRSDNGINLVEKLTVQK